MDSIQEQGGKTYNLVGSEEYFIFNENEMIYFSNDIYKDTIKNWKIDEATKILKYPSDNGEEKSLNIIILNNNNMKLRVLQERRRVMQDSTWYDNLLMDWYYSKTF